MDEKVKHPHPITSYRCIAGHHLLGAVSGSCFSTPPEAPKTQTHEWPRMNTDKKNPKSCSLVLSVFIRVHPWPFLFWPFRRSRALAAPNRATAIREWFPA